MAALCGRSCFMSCLRTGLAVQTSGSSEGPGDSGIFYGHRVWSLISCEFSFHQLKEEETITLKNATFWVCLRAVSREDLIEGEKPILQAGGANLLRWNPSPDGAAGRWKWQINTHILILWLLIHQDVSKPLLHWQELVALAYLSRQYWPYLSFISFYFFLSFLFFFGRSLVTASRKVINTF